jgi:hypothetical protein
MITPKMLLQIEGLALLAGAVALYAVLGGNGWVFLLLLLVPDAAMVGYVFNPKIGSQLYNLVHTYSLPLLLGLLAFLAGQTPLVLGALIWLAHIGMDRTIGYGLKYPTAFKDTHLQRA